MATTSIEQLIADAKQVLQKRPFALFMEILTRLRYQVAQDATAWTALRRAANDLSPLVCARHEGLFAWQHPLTTRTDGEEVKIADASERQAQLELACEWLRGTPAGELFEAAQQALAKYLARFEPEELTEPEKLEAVAFEKALAEITLGTHRADGTKRTVGTDRVDAAYKANLDAQVGEFAPSTIPTRGIPEAELVGYLKANAGTLNFADPYNAASQAHRYATRLPSPPAQADELVTYVRAAREVIKNSEGSVVPEQRPGTRSAYFRNSDGDLAIVFIDSSGDAHLSTFIPGES